MAYKIINYLILWILAIISHIVFVIILSGIKDIKISGVISSVLIATIIYTFLKYMMDKY